MALAPMEAAHSEKGTAKSYISRPQDPIFGIEIEGYNFPSAMVRVVLGPQENPTRSQQFSGPRHQRFNGSSMQTGTPFPVQ